MSAPRYRIPPKLLASLHERGLTVEKLAYLAGTGRAHATQVLAGVPGRGYRTRRKLAWHLTPVELELAGAAFHAERSKPISPAPVATTATRPDV